MELLANALLATFKEQYFAFLVNEEDVRREIATMIYCFKTNNKHEINRYIAEYMRTSALRNKYAWNTLRYFETNGQEPLQFDMAEGGLGMFGEDTIKIMPKLDFELTNKVTNQLCTIYNNGVKRTLVDKDGKEDVEQTKLYNNILADATIDKKQFQYYKDAWIFNTVLVQPTWREEKICLDIITPNFATVISEDTDYQKAKVIMIHKCIGEEDTIVYWSNTEHFYMTMNSVKIAVENNPDMENPYGELPQAKIQFNESSDYWGEPKQALVENVIWFNVGEANTFFVEMFQGLGVGLATNTGKNGQIQMKPNTIVAVDNVKKDETQPDIKFASTNAPLDELRQNSKARYERIGNSQGISSQSFSNDVKSQSGIGKQFDNNETDIIRSTHVVTMREGEKCIYEKVKLVYNYHSKKEKLKDDLKLVVDFAEDKPMVALTDKIANNEYRLKNGLVSKIDLMIEENPDLSPEQAKEKLIQIQKDNAIFEVETELENQNQNNNNNNGEGQNNTSNGSGNANDTD